jgi:hypothetical protein
MIAVYRGFEESKINKKKYIRILNKINNLFINNKT